MKKCVVVRGGGDIATGSIHKLWRAGFPVVVLETTYPSAIRRQVSLCEAVYQKEQTVEDLTACVVSNIDEIEGVWEKNQVPILIDPEGELIPVLKPVVLVDAILAKKNLGTTKDMAPCTVALGPGFAAGEDVDYVIETSRGHNLGRVIEQGPAKANSGIPGNIGGYTKERVMHAKAAGTIHNIHKIGDIVEFGEPIAYIETPNGERVGVEASLTGLIRGLIREGYPVTKGFKIADIDPRKEELKNCFTISDKARCIAGSVLEVVCAHWND